MTGGEETELTSGFQKLKRPREEECLQRSDRLRIWKREG